MNVNDYLSLMDKALKADIGVRVPCAPDDVERVRKRLYNLRDNLRIKGNHNYDALKFRVFDCSELWIVKEDALDARDDGIPIVGDAEQLQQQDLYKLPKPPFFRRH